MHLSLPSAIMAMRSPKISASSMLWVVRMMARPTLASWMVSHTKRRLMGSIPVVGSSRYTTLGSPSSAIATLSRRLIPPEYAPVRKSAAYVSLTFSRSMSASLFTALQFHLALLMRPYSRRCSRPVSSGHRTSNWGQTPIMDLILLRPPLERMLWPRMSASPYVGGSIPMSMLIVVVLPAPLGPSRQNSWLLGMTNHESLTGQKFFWARQLQQSYAPLQIRLRPQQPLEPP
mmetsp:Transcript_15855/g.43058  ORF Transcript_15855/g.43058 Transcript_15855/m.43058 type:complete len:231 (-) Transcript_15855:2274-2966(-)